MVGFEGIRSGYPGFQVNSQREQQRKQRDQKEKNEQHHRELKDDHPNDGKPHIDEFA
ncbi:MAG: hypothetical protein GXP08_03860 [Gammaproteobacteria bacterium]|nr:hypothetical protein [Gammaproteobacteria bacterium]